jgi:hypothetical protein
MTPEQIAELIAEIDRLQSDNRRLIDNAKAQGILDDIGAAGKSRASQARKLSARIRAQRETITMQHAEIARLTLARDCHKDAQDELQAHFTRHVAKIARLLAAQPTDEQLEGWASEWEETLLFVRQDVQDADWLNQDRACIAEIAAIIAARKEAE